MNDLQTVDLVESEEEFTLFEMQEETRLTTNIYEEIRRRLEQRGIPPSAIAFIHDTKNTEQRNALFAAVNRGDVRILIGSTERMGTGMNVQERCLAIHHLVPPWRPSDIEQQLGRGLRQGNLYRQIFQFVYITKGSFDGYSWQLLETKAGFIAQIESGKITAREMEDVGDTVMTMSEIKALASGNPLIMQKVVADSELTRLSAIHQGWKSSQNKQHWNIRSLESQRLDCLAAIESFTEAIQLRNASYISDSDGDRKRFRIQLRKLHQEASVEYTDREAAGKHLRDLATLAAISLKRHLVKENVHIGTFRGLPLYASVYQLKADLTPEPVVYIPIGKNNLMIHIGESDAGITQSLDTRARNLDGDLDELRKKLATLESRIASIAQELERPWELQARYDQVRAAVDELDRQLDLSQQATPETGELLTAKAQSLEPDDTALELAHALNAVRAMHCDPALLARFGVDSQPVAISRESLDAMEARIQSEEALLSFGRAVLGVNSARLSWDDWLHQQAPDAKTTPRRAKNAKESDGQLSMF